MRRAVGTRAGHQGDIAVAQRKQVIGRFGGTVAVVGDHHLRGFIQRQRSHAGEAAADLVQHVRQRLVLGRTRHQDHPMQLLLLGEAAHAVDVTRAAAVAGVHHQFEAGATQRIQRAVLHVHDVLRGGVVVDHADQERAAEGQATGQRVGGVADFAHQRFHLVARVLAHQRRVVDDP
ncbi:hypothetical protein D3C73_953820 [compost metagenome]